MSVAASEAQTPPDPKPEQKGLNLPPWAEKRLIPGVVLAAVIMGLVTFGLGLLNVPGIVMTIFIGALLIAVIALPILWRRFRAVRA